MYAVIEKNRIQISVAVFYNTAWYEKSRFPVFRYLARRFKFKETSLIRKGEEVYDLEGKRRSKIRLGQKRRRA